MEQALTALLAWAPEDAIFVSWSDNDLFQIKREMEGKGIVLPKMEKEPTWIDK